LGPPKAGVVVALLAPVQIENLLSLCAKVLLSKSLSYTTTPGEKEAIYCSFVRVPSINLRLGLRSRDLGFLGRHNKLA